jgi:hypothetical protein
MNRKRNDTDSGNGRPNQMRAVEGEEEGNPPNFNAMLGGDDDHHITDEGGEDLSTEELQDQSLESSDEDGGNTRSEMELDVPVNDPGLDTPPNDIKPVFGPQASQKSFSLESMFQMVLKQNQELREASIIAKHQMLSQTQKFEDLAKRQNRRMDTLQKELLKGRNSQDFKKGVIPKFGGKENESVDSWLMDITEYFTDQKKMMSEDNIRFVEMIIRSSALMGTAMSWYHSFKEKAKDQQRTRTWQYFQMEITNRFREKDYYYKKLSEVRSDRASGPEGMAGYISRFLNNIAIIKQNPDSETIYRWLFQEELEPDCNTYINQSIQDGYNIHDCIDLAQRYTDARSRKNRGVGSRESKGTTGDRGGGRDNEMRKNHSRRNGQDNRKKSINTSKPRMTPAEKTEHLKTIKCNKCGNMGHYASDKSCPKFGK